MMSNEAYADCYFCGGPVDACRMYYETRRGGQFYILEDVPTGCCRQCDERYYMAEVLKEVDRLLADPTTPAKRVEVPLIHFQPKVA